jgi:hypothetical protein
MSLYVLENGTIYKRVAWWLYINPNPGRRDNLSPARNSAWLTVSAGSPESPTPIFQKSLFTKSAESSRMHSLSCLATMARFGPDEDSERSLGFIYAPRFLLLTIACR